MRTQNGLKYIVLLAGLAFTCSSIRAQVFSVHDMINARYCENDLNCLDSLALHNGFSLAGVDSMRYEYRSYYISDLRLKTTTDPMILANNFASVHRTRLMVLDAKFTTCKEKQYEDIMGELGDFQFEEISRKESDDGHFIAHYTSPLLPYVTDCSIRSYTHQSAGMEWTYYECALTFSRD